MFTIDESKPKPSIKLKEMLIAAAAIVAITMAFAPAAFADDSCDEYADASVQQQGQNLVESCGFKGFRWHAWRDGHYQWCKGVSKRRVRHEVKRRENELEHCHDDF